MNRPETETSGPRRHNGMDHEAPPEELERDLARTRSDLNDTLRAIEHRFSREQLLDQALDYVRGGPRDFAVNLGEQARDNPLPVALTAIGIGWLMFASRKPERGSEYSPEYTSEGLKEEPGTRSYGGMAKERFSEMTEKSKEAYGSAAESMHEARATVGEKVSEAREGLKGRARAMASGMRRGSEETASGIRQTGEKTRDTFSYLLREQPLTVAALGIALGASLAAGLPTTRRERETFGPARDQTVNRAREFGREQMEATREDLKQAASEPPPHSGPH